MANTPAQSGDDADTAVAPTETEKAFEALLGTEDTLLVDFYAEWCGPCQMMAPIVEELAADVDATVAKVDVEELPPLAAQYDVKSIPAFVVFDDGETTDRLIGMQEKGELRAALQ